MNPHCTATVFSVKNLDTSLKFYTGILGFTEDFRYGEYADVKHGHVLIHLSQNHPEMRPPGSGAIYIFCDEVDSYHQTITARGAKTRTPPANWPYGMRDFTAYDPDENQVTFGTETKV